MLMLRPPAQEIRSLFPRPPPDHMDFRIPRSPFPHEPEVRMIYVDRVSSRKRRAIVIHNIDMRQPLDPEDGSNRITGPVCCCAADPPVFQDCSHRIETSIGSPRLILLMGIGGCSYEAMSNTLTRVGWAPVLVQGQGRGGSFHGQVNLCRQEPISLPPHSARGNPPRVQPGRSYPRPGCYRFGKKTGLRN